MSRREPNPYQEPSKLALVVEWCGKSWRFLILVLLWVLLFQAGLFQWNRNHLVDLNKVVRIVETAEGIQLDFADGKSYGFERGADGIIWQYEGGLQ